MGRREQVRRLKDCAENTSKITPIIISYTRAEVAEKGEKYGDDTHPQARKNMVIQL